MIPKKDVNKIRRRLDSVERLITEIRALLPEPESEEHPGKSAQVARRRSDDDGGLAADWLKIKEELMTSSNPQDLLRAYLSSRTKQEIRRLIEVNNLFVDPKAAKEEQLRQFLRMVAVSRTIRGNHILHPAP